MKNKTYKNLPKEEEAELGLWLGYLKESLDNSQTQISRWDRSGNNWDLELFFNSVVNIDNAAIGLKRFLNYGNDYINESQFFGILKNFRKDVKEYKIRNLRNDLVHREKIFKLQDEKGNPLPHNPLLILGGYNFTADEYQFGPFYNIKLSEVFAKVKKLKKDIEKIYAEKLKNFYASKNNKYESMIPFAHLRDFQPRM